MENYFLPNFPFSIFNFPFELKPAIYKQIPPVMNALLASRRFNVIFL